ncbi:conserved hypothetical integral membrane family protein [Orientia chuto str. Dubai]|uniref:Probable queuosine precursor transporter n=1 Tax=Orientia chuto str. Dubai TaxID=1359168 RepID=A0A0F3MKT5_9RICK|nr:queuosine precursor transporter [Candidatus Orientia mediorientalis]KJV56261.1 conserved hypothetical integral membrane family protein [Orientia chuto str. Dubai]
MYLKHNNDQNKLYIALCVLFSVLAVTNNMVYQKFVYLHFFGLYVFELSVGAILYPISFLITDIIAEFYGKNSAKYCIKLAIVMNIFVAIIIKIFSLLNATSWSKINNDIFDQMFGMYNIAFVGSVLASYISQIIDVKIYLGLKSLTKGKYLLIRNNVSTAISLFVDTCVVIGFLYIFKILPIQTVYNLIFNSYLFKLLFSVLSTPLFYLVVTVLAKNFTMN